MKYRASMLLTVWIAGCSHVSLRAPSKSAPDAERIAAYERLRPAAAMHDLTVRTSDGVVVDVDSSMVLADGTTVHHADDLLPIVSEESAAAAAAHRSASARNAKWLTYVIGYTAIAAGMIVMLYDADHRSDMYDETGDLPGYGAAFWGSVGAMGVGSGLVAVGAFYYGPKEQEHRRAAFVTYAEGLRQELDLCVDGMRVVACGASAEPSAMASPR